MSETGTRRKAQINLEFLAAAFIYLAALGTLVTAGQGVLPEFSSDAQEAALNLEARQVSTTMLTTAGSHTYSGGGTDWEASTEKMESADSFGLASDFMVVERDKLQAIRTADIGYDDNRFNYSEFKDVTGADHQYQFDFTWMPIVETSGSFTRGEAETDPSIPVTDEPSTEYYSRAGNTVHYGEERLNGTTYHFLVTSHDGVYNTTYVSPSWNFEVFSNLFYGPGDSFSFAGDTDSFTVEKFQNREDEPGAMLMLSQHLKTFGANVDSDSKVISMDRYAAMEGEPLRVEILAW